MTLLTMSNTIADRCRISRPATIIGNSNENARLILAMIEMTGTDIRDSFQWAELQKEYTFSTVDSQDAYALPADFNQVIYDTHWDRTQMWPLIGPISPQDWQWMKSGIAPYTPRTTYRVKGYKDAQFYIIPTPTADSDDDTLVFEYATKTWCRPRTWVTATVFAAASYCFYNGNIYYTTAGGTTGVTAPTWTSGTQSDGVVSWTYVSAAYEAFTADTDLVILNEEMIIDGAVWRLKRELGLFYEEQMQQALDAIERKKTDLTSATAINFKSFFTWGRRWPFGSVPDGNWPTS